MDHPIPAPMTACPCGSGRTYSHCCQPLHQGAIAVSPEALMRSRYCAYALGLTDYLLATWHLSTRPSSLALTDDCRWVSLVVQSSGASGDSGWVQFRATYRSGANWGFLAENSRFVREDGRWYYVAGDVSGGDIKPGRNDPCPCGSGSKFKKCCAGA